MKWVSPIIWVGEGWIEPKNIVEDAIGPKGDCLAWTCCRYEGCCSVE
ncbi:MAG: hypothetical protein ABIM60_03015 [candidate division WOR-3 bacterium]